MLPDETTITFPFIRFSQKENKQGWQKKGLIKTLKTCSLSCLFGACSCREWAIWFTRLWYCWKDSSKNKSSFWSVFLWAEISSELWRNNWCELASLCFFLYKIEFLLTFHYLWISGLPVLWWKCYWELFAVGI